MPSDLSCRSLFAIPALSDLACCLIAYPLAGLRDCGAALRGSSDAATPQREGPLQDGAGGCQISRASLRASVALTQVPAGSSAWAVVLSGGALQARVKLERYEGAVAVLNKAYQLEPGNKEVANLLQRGQHLLQRQQQQQRKAAERQRVAGLAGAMLGQQFAEAKDGELVSTFRRQSSSAAQHEQDAVGKACAPAQPCRIDESYVTKAEPHSFVDYSRWKDVEIDDEEGKGADSQGTDQGGVPATRE